jgi:hypothetical protein
MVHSVKPLWSAWFTTTLVVLQLQVVFDKRSTFDSLELCLLSVGVI